MQKWIISVSEEALQMFGPLSYGLFGAKSSSPSLLLLGNKFHCHLTQNTVIVIQVKEIKTLSATFWHCQRPDLSHTIHVIKAIQGIYNDDKLRVGKLGTSLDVLVKDFVIELLFLGYKWQHVKSLTGFEQGATFLHQAYPAKSWTQQQWWINPSLV